MKFDSKIVLITGASRGIGRATAIAFAAKGAKIALNYRANLAAAMETLDTLEGEGHILVKADIANAEEISAMIAEVTAHFGKLDILVNNAGIFEYHPIDKVDYETWQAEWQRTININLIGAANMMYCAAQQMIKQGGGRIVNVSSRGAFRGEPLQPAYGASKAGMNAMGQSLAQALAPYNIFVGTIAPGFVETDMAKSVLDGRDGDYIRDQSPVGRVAKPEEVAHGILFLASEGAEFMTGAILDINGASYLRS
ncbi:MAG: SDR family NAD(P)-dependent oxidoreductase [Saprospiraceae bacterium]